MRLLPTGVFLSCISVALHPSLKNDAFDFVINLNASFNMFPISAYLFCLQSKRAAFARFVCSSKQSAADAESQSRDWKRAAIERLVNSPSSNLQNRGRVGSRRTACKVAASNRISVFPSSFFRDRCLDFTRAQLKRAPARLFNYVLY